MLVILYRAIYRPFKLCLRLGLLKLRGYFESLILQCLSQVLSVIHVITVLLDDPHLLALEASQGLTQPHTEGTGQLPLQGAAISLIISSPVKCKQYGPRFNDFFCTCMRCEYFKSFGYLISNFGIGLHAKGI